MSFFWLDNIYPRWYIPSIEEGYLKNVWAFLMEILFDRRKIDAIKILYCFSSRFPENKKIAWSATYRHDKVKCEVTI